jgi:uncharacterized membrane protein affecting hemolysin expression
MSFKLRIALVIFLLGTVVSAIMAWYLADQLVDNSRLQAAQIEKLAVDMVRQAGASALITEEYFALHPLLDFFADDQNVVQILLTDADDRVVASTRPHTVGTTLPSLESTPTSYWRVRDVEGPTGKLGRVAIEFSTASQALTANGAWARWSSWPRRWLAVNASPRPRSPATTRSGALAVPSTGSRRCWRKAKETSRA